MVTVITEQLQKQSLDDLACKAFNINLPLPENTNKGGCWNPYRYIPEERKWNVLDTSNAELPVNMGYPSLTSYNINSIDSSSQNKSLWTGQATSTWMGHVTSTSVGNLSDLQFTESFASLPDPPTKRHCRSLSVPEDLSRCRSLWKPIGSKVWTPVKRRCNSGGNAGAQLCNPTQRPTSLGLQQLPNSGLHSNTSSFTFSSLTASPESPLPWMLSPNNHSTDIGERTFLGVQCILPEQCTFIPQRRFSLSPVHIREAARCLLSAKSTPSSTPEMNRRQQGLLRSHSQPCDLNERKCGIKRRHDEDVRWTRPALDFFKMNQEKIPYKVPNVALASTVLCNATAGSSGKSAGRTPPTFQLLCYQVWNITGRFTIYQMACNCKISSTGRLKVIAVTASDDLTDDIFVL
uniref:protein FAM53C isoform X2 n=1 Tax=Pristiophorus japonicus TaxID=55135 RepID=UPI00398E50F9